MPIINKRYIQPFSAKASTIEDKNIMHIYHITTAIIDIPLAVGNHDFINTKKHVTDEVKNIDTINKSNIAGNTSTIFEIENAFKINSIAFGNESKRQIIIKKQMNNKITHTIFKIKAKKYFANKILYGGKAIILSNINVGFLNVSITFLVPNRNIPIKRANINNIKANKAPILIAFSLRNGIININSKIIPIIINNFV